MVLKNWLIFAVLWVSICGQTIRQDISSWSLEIQGDPLTYYNITTPSTLSTDLITIGLIPKDPYYRDNFLRYYQYETKRIKYTTWFKPQLISFPPSAPAQLVFQGLDTNCKVYLNGKQILVGSNMFRKYVINLENLESNNSLSIEFDPPASHDMQSEKKFYDEYGFNLPQNYSFSRKAAYQYGWDWGPRILTVGIWKPVYLLLVSIIWMENPVINVVSSITKNMSVISFSLKAKVQEYYYNDYNVITTIQTQNEKIILDNSTWNKTMGNPPGTYDKMFTISGVNNISKFIWWTWDLGEPNLFNLTVQFMQGNKIMCSKSIFSGFRTVQVKQQKDSTGTGFVINLNGIDLFIRGGNYIPPQMSMAQVPNKTYSDIRDYAVFGKYNMIRIWGGGQFEHDLFYETMDRAGILIWHDLMFACAMYPVTYDELQLENIQHQMEDNLYRIGHHPSIALWNGNNQVWIGWLEWGWQRNLDRDQKFLAEQMYNKIFKYLLPTVISKITPTIFYWQTSPSSSSNQVSTIGSGDIHFWRVWGGGTPIEEFEQFVGRFNSEYGMQSMSHYSSIIKFTQQSDRVIDSYILRLHERHPLGDKYLSSYTKNYSGQTKNLRRYTYYTQVMQSYALELAIVSLRGSKPYCMGSIYWQLNDVWPVSSWSTVDYYGMYKIAHYRVNQLHNQLLLHLVHTQQTNSTSEIYKIFATNQLALRVSLFTVVSVLDFNGTLLFRSEYEKSVNAFGSLVVAILNVSNFNKVRSFVNMKALSATTNQTYENNYFFAPPVKRLLLDPQISYKVSGNKISITAKNVANYVWVDFADESVGYNFKINYFDVLPGQTVEFTDERISGGNIIVSCYQCERVKDLKQENEQMDLLIQ